MVAEKSQARPVKGWAKFNSKTGTAEYWPDGQAENKVIESDQTKDGFHKRWQAMTSSGNGQSSSPAPFQNGASKNEQGIYSDIRLINGESGLTFDNSSDRKNEVENEKILACSFSRPSGSTDTFLVFRRLSDSRDSQETDSALCEVKNDRTQETKTLFQEPESGILGSVLTGSFSDSQIPDLDARNTDRVSQSARLTSPANQANFDAGNATKKQAKDVAQMPQSNATKATTQNIEFARPSGWGKLWRLVQNGNYYYYELRFINADRVRQKGGKITPAIARKLAARKGKGRHEKSRKEAERFRGAAEHLAERIRTIS